MIRTVITGVGGRMGSALVRLTSAHPDMELVGATERSGSPLVGKELGGVQVSADLAAILAAARPQVVIDFTSAEGSVANARACGAADVAMVIGSTGLDAHARAAIAEQARVVPVVLSPNMSIGVNVVFQVAAQLARMLGDGYDVEIVEAHHRLKKDAPSGTALRLAEEVAAALGRGPEDFRTAREGLVGERPAREIGIQTVRGGDIVGEHTVLFIGDGERVELVHRATNRDQFAQGALRAARWVAGRGPGLYGMADVLGAMAPRGA